LKIKKKWEYNNVDQVLGLELGFLDEFNKKFLLAYGKSGKILILSLSGLRLYDENITHNIPIWNCKVNDIDNDGKSELLLGGLDGLLRVFKFNPDFSLRPYWEHQFGSSISGMLVDDINNDGTIEIIAYSLDKSLRVLNPFNGSLIWGQVFEDGIGDAIIWRDSYKPSNSEIIACSNDGTIRIFNCISGELIWFKKFTDKVRCLSSFRSTSKNYIICGGDDKRIHIIDKNKREEVKTVVMSEIIWNMMSFPPDTNKLFIISSYSFDFLSSKIPIEEIEFISKIICMNEDLKIIWERKNINTEIVKYIQTPYQNFVGIGTTKGTFLILNEKNGELLAQLKSSSCLNDFQFVSESNQLIMGYDNGFIHSYNIS
jgi:WD40 repeat protein